MIKLKKALIDQFNRDAEEVRNSLAGARLLQAQLDILGYNKTLNMLRFDEMADYSIFDPTPYKKRCTKVEIGNALTYMILKDIPAQYYLNLIQKDEYALFTESIRPPSKDDIYEFQKRLDPQAVEEFVDNIARKLHKHGVIDLNIVFIDGHVIVYFGKASVSKIRHATRGRIMKAIEMFSANDIKGNPIIFVLKSDGSNIKQVIPELVKRLQRIFGKQTVKIVVFDRGGFKTELFIELKDERGVDFISLAVRNPKIIKEVAEIIKNKLELFKPLHFDSEERKLVKDVADVTLTVKGIGFRCGIIRDLKTGKINIQVTSIKKDEKNCKTEMTGIAKIYSKHWNQEDAFEQEKNGMGLDKHARYDLIQIPNAAAENKKNKLSKQIKSKDNEMNSIRGEISTLEKILKTKQDVNISSIKKRMGGELKKIETEKKALMEKIEKIDDDEAFYKLNTTASTFKIANINYLFSAHNSLFNRIKNKYSNLDFNRAKIMVYQHGGSEKLINNRLIITLDPFRNKTIHNFVVELCDELNKESPRSPKGHIMEFHVKDWKPHR